MSNSTETPHATRRWQFRRLLGSLAAILVVGMLIAVAFLLFTPHQTPVIGAAIGPVRAPGTTHVQAGGFEMTLGITPGPYFISEMLEVNSTLTNHTAQAQRVGVPFENGCGYAPGLHIKEDLKPAFELPPMDHKCPAGAGQHFEISPGQTLSAHKYFVLQWSGTITLTSYIEFDSDTNNLARPAQSPLDGHWPTMRIHVASQVPQDRQLTTHIKDTHITVDAPVQAHLQYLYGIFCTNGSNFDSEFNSNYGWEALNNTTVNQPGCSKKHITWSYAIGTPGYAIASGKVKSDA